jgi:hypothetical protein
MSPPLFSISLVAASILISATLAWAWGKNRRWFGYVVSTVAIWVGISTLPLFTQPWEPATFPVDWPHFLSTVIALAPLALVPMLVLVGLVLKSSPLRQIGVASAVASTLALPMCVFSGLYASCYVLHDCL